MKIKWCPPQNRLTFVSIRSNEKADSALDLPRVKVGVANIFLTR